MDNNLRNLELLAPAGKWDVMTEVLAAGADAVYLGGKRFNMRLLRPDFNFSDQELKEAVSYAHERGKKIYVTVNNIYYEDEMADLADYLSFLAAIGPDALIVQDLAVAALAHRLQLGLPLHASVQMGIANSQSALWLEELGFERAILSKNVSMEEIAAIHQKSGLELEYFVHGDVCISHAGQCYMSAFIFGDSGNRGRCRKPCRWQYRLQGAEEQPAGYYLAHKDWCLIEYLPELAGSGITSFKIEGRMRDAAYLALVVGAYRQALDRLLMPTDYRVEQEADLLWQNRARDFTSAGLRHRPARDDIGISGEREPHFPTAPVKLPLTTTVSPGAAAKTPPIQVKVDSQEALEAVVKAGAQVVIIGGDEFYPATTMNIAHAAARAAEGNSELVYQLPRVIGEDQLPRVAARLDHLRACGVGMVLVSDPGSLRLAREKGCKVWADFGLNLANSEATGNLQAEGVGRVTAALELTARELTAWLPHSPLPVDVLVHGRLPGMVTDLCLRRLAGEGCPREGKHDQFFLVDQLGQQYPVYCDRECRNHIAYPHELSLLGHLPALAAAGCSGFRLDLTGYPPEQAAAMTALYIQACRAGEREREQLLGELRRVSGHTFTDHPYMMASATDRS